MRVGGSIGVRVGGSGGEGVCGVKDERSSA